jgi:hypothetical protein
MNGRALLEGLPTVDELKVWEEAVTHPKTDLEAPLATQNAFVALYKMRRRLEAVAMGRDVEATVFEKGGGQ